MEQISRIGMDTSKHVFQLHGVNAAEAPVLRKKLRRKEMVAFFEKLSPTLIAIEACGASHQLARLLQSFGHTVKLIAPQLVKPYVKRGKNDAADAEATLWSNHHQISFSALDINNLRATAIDERRSCHKSLNSLYNPMGWWWLLHNIAKSPKKKVRRRGRPKSGP